jgi:hypothetical protein
MAVKPMRHTGALIAICITTIALMAVLFHRLEIEWLSASINSIIEFQP